MSIGQLVYSSVACAAMQVLYKMDPDMMSWDEWRIFFLRIERPENI